MQQLLRDLRFSVRSLGRRWPFTVPILACLALGIGANSAVFSLVNAVLLRPLPFADASRLVILFDVSNGLDYNISPANYLEWRRRATSFTGLEVLDTRYFNLTGGESPERLPGGAVTAGLFDLLGLEPVAGRTFLPEEDLPGGPKVVLLSHGAWVRRFGSDPQILERRIVLGGESRAIVGVMPPGAEKFIPPRFLVEGAELWVPLALDPVEPEKAQGHFLYAVGRLAAGVSRETALEEMQALARQLGEDFPQTNGAWGANVVDLRENWVGDIRRPLLLILSAVSFVLLIACANVGHLLMTRAAEQQGEMAVRMAFGARRRDVVRQYSNEGVLLALGGGLLGLGVAALTLKILPFLLPVRLHHQLRHLDLDARVLVFTSLISLVAGVLPGLLASWRITSQDPLPRLNQRDLLRGGPGRRVLRDGLVATEIALTLVLLVATGLTVKSLGRLGKSPVGFDPQGVLTVSFSLPSSRYADLAASTGFYREVKEKVRALPGVTGAGVSSRLPINRFGFTTTFQVEHRVPAEPGEELMANYQHTDGDYFRTLGIPLLDGRLFSDADEATSPPVAIVSREIAERYWPGGQAVGRRILRPTEAEEVGWRIVVGVIDEVQDEDVGTRLGSRGAIYVPYSQRLRPNMYLSVRSTLETETLLPAIRRAVQEVDPDQPIGQVETLEDRLAASLSGPRFNAFLLLVFSGLSMILAVTGIYGLLSYSVSRRIREMGMRMALGATTRDILTLVLRRALAFSAAGLGAGALLAFLLSRLFKSLLYEVEPTDPSTFLGMLAVLALTCVAAGLRPAWRASRCDPTVALKSE